MEPTVPGNKVDFLLREQIKFTILEKNGKITAVPISTYKGNGDANLG